MGSIVLSDEQQKAVDMSNAGKNVLVTGGGGRGKSVVIREVTDENTVLIAPTGAAALLVNGTTAHKAFHLPIGVPVLTDFMTVSKKVQNLFSPRSAVKKIVIDEGSMIRTDMFELMNARLQNIRGNRQLFGGLAVTIISDYYQLAPVLTQREEEAFYSQYKSVFNFNSDIFDFDVVELTKSYRQDNQRHVEMLDSIRQKDKYYKLALQAIVKEARPYQASPSQMILCCYKNDQRRYNNKYFRLLDTPIFEYKAKIENVKKDDEWRDSTVSHNLKLRVGAKVIFRANDRDGKFVNGERGEVVYLDKVSVIVRKNNGVEVSVLPNVWEKHEYSSRFNVLEKEVVSRFSQIPLDLGYAITIHQAQGSEFEDMAIDLGRKSFSHGQTYVALSRAKDLSKVSFVRPPTPEDVICAKEVKEFYRRIRNE